MHRRSLTGALILGWILLGLGWRVAGAGDLEEVRQRGVLRHLGIPYANFVTGSGDGLDVELMQRFARHLGVRYEYVPTTWKDVIADLTGTRVKVQGAEVEVVGTAPVRGDLVANGFTILPWRQKVVDFSTPTFPSGVWLIARADAALSPISESGSHQGDIDQVRERLHQTSVLAMKGTCLDPDLYRLQDTRAEVRLYTRSTNLNEMVPAILRRDAETTLLDVPDALIALEKWPGEVKVIGPVSPRQEMGVAFPKTSPKLREAFNALFAGLWADGTYARMVRRYYPSVFHYYPDFFRTP